MKKGSQHRRKVPMTTPSVTKALCSRRQEELRRLRSLRTSSIFVPDEANTEFLAFALASIIAVSKLIRFTALFLISSPPFVAPIESLLSGLICPSFSAGDTELFLCRVSLTLPLFTSNVSVRDTSPPNESFTEFLATGSARMFVIFSMAVFCFMASL